MLGRARLSWTDDAGDHALELNDVRTVGSAPWCQLVLADRAVSRVHAELAPRDDGLWVRDLGSRNGTYVAGIKVHDARVPMGAVIRFGTTDLVVTYDAAAKASLLPTETSFGPLRGASSALRAVFGQLGQLARTDAAVLFVGERGTGKRSFARALHDAAATASGTAAAAPFVVLDCAALPGPVDAAEIIEQSLIDAEGGTLLLIEPGELPLSIQRELIPPLDAKAFRVLATSARDLRVLVNQGTFRESLYGRLVAGATITLPPLRERLDDLPILLEQLLGDRATLLTPSLLADLARVPWTGNVTELRDYAARLRTTDGDVREFPEAPEPSEDVVPTVESEQPQRLPGELEPWFETGFKEFRERWIDLGEREYLRRLMKRTGRSSGAASRDAGLERTYLYRLLKKHGV